MRGWQEFWTEEEGAGVVEVVLIIVDNHLPSSICL